MNKIIRNKQDPFPGVRKDREKKKGGDLYHPALVQTFAEMMI